MQKNLINGGTSFELVRIISKLMEREGVSDDYTLVSKYYSVLKPTQKYIYLAYDSEGVILGDRGTVELEHFDRVADPELVVVFGEMSKIWYEKHGYNTYLMPLGYDDINHKEHNIQRDIDIGFVGSLDSVRWSVYHQRLLLAKTIAGFWKKSCFMNNVAYDDINEFFSRCVIGFNDLIYPSPNMRLYEIPSNGAFMLINDMACTNVKSGPPKNLNISLKYPLRAGRDYWIYEDVKDLIKKIGTLLSNKEQTLRRAESAKKKILKYPISKEVTKMVDRCNLR